MGPQLILDSACQALRYAGRHTADRLGSAASLDVQIPRSDWTVADAAAHVVVSARVLAGVAGGEPFPFANLTREEFAAENARRIDEIDETDPTRLARLLLDALGQFDEGCVGHSPEDLVDFYPQMPLPRWALACIALAEQLLHRYDMAGALGRPFPIDPAEAGLVLAGYAPILPLMVDAEAAKGLTAAVEVDVRGAARFVARFDDGGLALTPPDEATVDAVLSADPVALLLIASGRLPLSSAVALGTAACTGPRPDLAVGFPDLFVYP
jgi:uncharacterized protein (TIGR03083 family)